MKKECNTVSFKNQVIYVGIDIHKNSWQVSIRHCRHQLANFSMNPDALKLAEHLRRISAQPAPSGFESDSVVCSSTNRNNGRTAWDAKDEIIGRRN